MTKVNVSFSQEIPRELDKATHEANTSRSAFLALAVRHYLEERDEQQQRERGKQAAATMDRIREKGSGDGTGRLRY